MRALVAAMGEKLAAMQHLVATSDRHNRDLASQLRQLRDRYTDVIDVTCAAESPGKFDWNDGFVFAPGRVGDERFVHWEKVWTRINSGTESSASGY